MTTAEEINLIYAFVHKGFKKVTSKGKAIFWRASKFVLIKDLPVKDYKNLLLLASLEKKSFKI